MPLKRIYRPKVYFGLLRVFPIKLGNMLISVEPTFSRLRNNFKTYAIGFLKKLCSNKLVRMENVPIAKVYVEYDALMTILNEKIRIALRYMDKGFAYI